MSSPAALNDVREPASERALDTRESLLDAAEELFGRRGFEGASTRAITRAAGTSLSAVNYHFGSKEGLLRAILRRRLEPVNRLRLERLDALEGDPPEGGLPIESILDAFLRPALEMRAASADAPTRYRQVAARLYSDPPELVSALKRELFGTIGERFLAALARALPDRPLSELALAWQFTVGVMVHVMAGHLEAVPGSPVDLEALPDDAILERMVAFAAAGLRASAATDESRAPAEAPP